MKKILVTISSMFCFLCSSHASFTVSADMERQTITVSNASGNYKATITPYAWSSTGEPQYMLTIEQINPNQPSVVDAKDLLDPYYWEPIFAYQTQGTAKAQDKIKRLHVKNVRLHDGQFKNYRQLRHINLEYDNECTIPSTCFQNAELLDTLVCKCPDVYIQPDALPNNTSFNIETNNSTVSDKFVKHLRHTTTQAKH